MSEFLSVFREAILRAVVAALAFLAAVLFARFAGRCALRDLRPLARSTRSVLVAFFIAASVLAQKSLDNAGLGDEPSTSLVDRAASLLCLMPQSVDEEVEDDAPVTELRFRSFSVGERSLVFTAEWPQGMRFYDDWIYLRGTSDLADGPWIDIAAIDVSSVTGAITVELAYADFPQALDEGVAFFKLEGDPLAEGEAPDSEDSDGDGLPDGLERMLGSDPLSADTDGDGVPDGEEVARGLNPLSTDTDGDGVPDGEEVAAGSDGVFSDLPLDSGAGPYYEFVGVNVYSPVEREPGPPSGGGVHNLFNVPGWVPRFGIEYYESWADPQWRRGEGSRFRALKTGYYTFQLAADDAAWVYVGDDVVTATYPDLGSPVTIFMRENEERDVRIEVWNDGGPTGLRFEQITYSPYEPIQVMSGFNDATLYYERGTKRATKTLFMLAAKGGEFGGTLTFTTENQSRIRKVFGMNLPTGSVSVSAGAPWICTGFHEGVSASEEEEDVKIITTFRENETDLVLVSTAKVTVVEVNPPPEIRRLEFLEDAMFYEDPYRNLPGEEMVAKRRQGAALAYELFGGENGADVEINVPPGPGCMRASSASLPVRLHVGPEQTLTGTIPFEPEQYSSSASVSAKLTDSLTGLDRSRRATIPIIKVELEAVYTAPENSNTNRHVYGVGEKVRFNTYPEGVDVKFEAQGSSVLESYYGKFGKTDDSDAYRVYVCAIASDCLSRAVVCCGEACYIPQITIQEPERLVGESARYEVSSNIGLGDVGGVMLYPRVYVYPKYVSFHGIKMGEVPCEVEDEEINGYYDSANYTGLRTHSGNASGWRLKRIDMQNYWTEDRVGSPAAVDNWSAGRMVWKTPVGWFRLSSDDDNFGSSIAPEHTELLNPSSPSLLVGRSIDAYKQTVEISNSGEMSVEKFGWRVTRSRWGMKTLQRIGVDND